jgi:N-acyl-D-amino-acid deacylase
MTYDVAITGGTVVDGTGRPGFRADVGVRADRIVAVGELDETAERTIDAEGRIVTPGFVDVHTHLDAQLAWDPVATSSCWHGVTSVVLGNCGVTFAPCKPEDREYLAEMMQSVEDIPRDSILEGLSWDWETYGEYLAEIDRLPKGVNVGGMVGHCALRQYAMGERGLGKDAPTDDDLKVMCEQVDDAMRAGALGFSTSRTRLHRVPDGRPVPGTYAPPSELLALAEVLGRHGRGVVEVAPRLGEGEGDDYERSRAEVAWMADIVRRTGRPVTFGMSQVDVRPELHRKVLQFVDEEAARGARLRPQTTARGIALIFGLPARTFFDRAPSWSALQPLSLGARLAVLDDDARRAELVRDAEASTPPLDFHGVYLLGTPEARYAYTDADSLAAHAEAAGESIAAAFVRISRESRGRMLFSYPFLNQRMDAVDEMLDHPAILLGLGDSGAHVGLIMDASLPTFFLSYWVRDRGKFTIEDGVRRLTSDTAGVFGLHDRGVIRTGAYADLNVIDVDALRLPPPEYVHDFPGGAGRYVQGGEGYDATLVNGDVFMLGGEPTGELPGVLVRS